MQVFQIAVDFLSAPTSRTEERRNVISLPADKFFSWIALGWIQLYGLEDFQPVLQKFIAGRPPWRHSDLFPLYDGSIWLPAPKWPVSSTPRKATKSKPKRKSADSSSASGGMPASYMVAGPEDLEDDAIARRMQQESGGFDITQANSDAAAGVEAGMLAAAGGTEQLDEAAADRLEASGELAAEEAYAPAGTAPPLEENVPELFEGAGNDALEFSQAQSESAAAVEGGIALAGEACAGEPAQEDSVASLTASPAEEQSTESSQTAPTAGDAPDVSAAAGAEELPADFSITARAGGRSSSDEPSEEQATGSVVELIDQGALTREEAFFAALFEERRIRKNDLAPLAVRASARQAKQYRGWLLAMDDSLIDKLNSCLEFMAAEGFGANRSSGAGAVASVEITVATGYERLARAGRRKITGYVLLSPCCPNPEFIEAIEAAPAGSCNYSLRSCSGWIYDGSGQPTSMRKPLVRSFDTGSVFSCKPEGGMIATGTQEHPAYKYGFPFTICN